MTTDATLAPPTPNRGPRWLRIALIASVALNVLVLGVVAGTMWRLRDAAASGQIGSNMLAYSSTLSGERRETIRQMFTERRATIRPLRQAARQARREMVRSLTTEPFDKAAFLAAQARVLEAEAKVRREIALVVADAAEKLSPEERRSFTRWRGSRRGPGGGDGDLGADHEGEPGKGRPRRR